jgi:hypothetical protein
MKRPILIFKKNDKNIYAIDSMFGIVSKGGESFYKNTTIIDSEGNLFEVIKIEVQGRASLKHCIMYFQKLLELKLTFSSNKKTIGLTELKNMIISKISKNPKKWLSMGTVEGISEHVNKSKSFSELISMFK